jgi:hypothetical protein
MSVRRSNSEHAPIAMGGRNLVIAMLAAVFVTALGVALFWDSQVGIQLTAVAAFAVSQALLLVLDERERKHRGGG